MYAIQINLNRVRDTDDLLLQIIDVIRNVDRKQVPEKKGDKICKIPLTRKGIQKFGSLTVEEVQ